jgi:hypothetical protein
MPVGPNESSKSGFLPLGRFGGRFAGRMTLIWYKCRGWYRHAWSDNRGRATLRGAGIINRAVPLPVSEGSVAIDHVLGAMNYRSLRADEVRSTQVNFRRLPTPRVATFCPL